MRKKAEPKCTLQLFVPVNVIPMHQFLLAQGVSTSEICAKLIKDTYQEMVILKTSESTNIDLSWMKEIK